MIESVNDRGIFGRFQDQDNAVTTGGEEVFYSWGGIVSIQTYGRR
ncbi:MAG: hypothetical protein WKF95_15415 [Rubrobacter sp.]